MATKFQVVRAIVLASVSMEQFNKIVATYGDADAQAAQILKWKAEGWFFADNEGKDVVSRSAATQFLRKVERLQIAPEGYTGTDMPDVEGITDDDLAVCMETIQTSQPAKQTAYALNNGNRLYRKPTISAKPKGSSAANEAKAHAANLTRFVVANATNAQAMSEFTKAQASGSAEAFIAEWASKNPPQ